MDATEGSPSSSVTVRDRGTLIEAHPAHRQTSSATSSPLFHPAEEKLLVPLSGLRPGSPLKIRCAVSGSTRVDTFAATEAGSPPACGIYRPTTHRRDAEDRSPVAVNDLLPPWSGGVSEPPSGHPNNNYVTHHHRRYQDANASPVRHTERPCPAPQAHIEEQKPATSSSKSAFLERFILGPLLGKGAYAPVHLATHRHIFERSGEFYADGATTLKSKLTRACFELRTMMNSWKETCTRFHFFTQKTGNLVAVKIYEGFRGLNRDRKAVIVREIRVMRRLSHESIVKYAGIYNEANALYVLMQYLNGGSLRSLVKNNPKGKLSEDEARVLFRQVCSALQHMHSRKIVHRDLKLENILLDSKGRVKLIDFGFASIMKEGVLCRMRCGTPSYMPPEILMKKEYDGSAADVWSLGVVLYVMLHGCYPFRGHDLKELYAKIIQGDFTLSGKLSDEAQQLICGMLLLEPQDRLTAEEILCHPWVVGEREERPEKRGKLALTRLQSGPASIRSVVFS